MFFLSFVILMDDNEQDSIHSVQRGEEDEQQGAFNSCRVLSQIAQASLDL